MKSQLFIKMSQCGLKSHPPTIIIKRKKSVKAVPKINPKKNYLTLHCVGIRIPKCI